MLASWLRLGIFTWQSKVSLLASASGGHLKNCTFGDDTLASAVLSIRFVLRDWFKTIWQDCTVAFSQTNVLGKALLNTRKNTHCDWMAGHKLGCFHWLAVVGHPELNRWWFVASQQFLDTDTKQITQRLLRFSFSAATAWSWHTGFILT